MPDPTSPPLFNIKGGIAVVATNTWSAFEGRKALKIKWNFGANAEHESISYKEKLIASASAPGTTVLNRGDAMIYFGMTAPHWREEYTGNACTQLFMHYVRSRGKYATFYFNKERKVVIDQPRKKEDIPVKVEPLPKANTLDQFIRVYDNILTHKECKLILDEYAESKEWYDAMVGGGVKKDNVRKCQIAHISLKEVISKNEEIRKKIDTLVFDKAGGAASQYIQEFPHCNISTDSGYDLLRYKEGGFYTIHTDNYKDRPRTVAMSLMLNDDYDGGEIAFFEREHIIKPSAGSVVIFPANFMYPHEIMPVLSGTRYAIITWFT